MSDHSVTGGFARRLAHLRGRLRDDPAEAGDQGLKLLEEYLEYQAIEAGYRQERGSIGRYASWLRRRGPLGEELLDRAEAYAQVRNCLAHSYGLQTSPDLAAEVVEFLGALIRQEADTAEQMMSARMRTVAEGAPLSEARDTMLREGFGQLPVLREGAVVALLTERDLVAADMIPGGRANGMTVGEALSAQSRRRLGVIAADASHAAVVEALRRPGVAALIVTRDGKRAQRPLGIITHADVLYRM
ncbi:CBS domain-containing protein [Oscillochloris sp. ZM17-4]|uniref:CBS domain-containing protein n=1 Tax=Oscillochloris sp. ZM17-4 TaxID=2866714 RepID=UPI001C73A60B|nr:CBS domain-containing protein [Oscillochloris sp. ZM17-4]MBX0329751.1 CBS domain-containing protein [Oscillochloris sp. ZM17-4]